MSVGRWSDNARLEDAHVVLDSSLIPDRFAQLEFSTCLTDGARVLIVKNLTDLAGRGAITRINTGAKNRHEKVARRKRLVEALDADVVEWNGKEWLVVFGLRLSQARKRSQRVFAEALRSFLRYAGEVEAQTRSSEQAGRFLHQATKGGGLRYRMSKADRDRVEAAAMSAVAEALRSQQYVVSDVSTRYVGCDLIATRRDEELWVEVKGTTIDPWCVELTANEHAAAEARANGYALMVAVFDDIERLQLMRIETFRNPLGESGCVVAPVRYSVSKNAESD